MYQLPPIDETVFQEYTLSDILLNNVIYREMTDNWDEDAFKLNFDDCIIADEDVFSLEPEKFADRLLAALVNRMFVLGKTSEKGFLSTLLSDCGVDFAKYQGDWYLVSHFLYCACKEEGLKMQSTVESDERLEDSAVACRLMVSIEC